MTIFGWGGLGGKVLITKNDKYYFGVNFGHPKSEVFQNGGGYFGVNFGHPKSEVCQKGGWGGILE